MARRDDTTAPAAHCLGGSAVGTQPRAGGDTIRITGNTGATVEFFETDQRGNVIGLINGSSVAQHLLFGPWGAIESQSGRSLDETRLGWKGLMWEGGATGLYYVRARWYDPATRSFISEDPTGIAGGLYTYAFAGNDPVNGQDPTGLWGISYDDDDDCITRLRKLAEDSGLPPGDYEVELRIRMVCAQKLPPVITTAGGTSSGGPPPRSGWPYDGFSLWGNDPIFGTGVGSGGVDEGMAGAAAQNGGPLWLAMDGRISSLQGCPAGVTKFNISGNFLGVPAEYRGAAYRALYLGATAGFEEHGIYSMSVQATTAAGTQGRYTGYAHVDCVLASLIFGGVRTR
jgi:RHS repeat-associated protein